MEDDPSSWPQWVSADLSRDASDEYWETWYDNKAAYAEFSRDGGHVSDAAWLANQEAAHAKEQAVDAATSQKEYAVNVAGADSSDTDAAEDAGKQRDAALAAHTLQLTTDDEDAKLQYQKWETIGRKGYSSSTATDQRARDTSLAALARDTAKTEAGYQYNADQAFAAAEVADWSFETQTDNAVALQRAQADAALWTAEEQANVTALQAIDAVYSLPWTDFLVAQAQAHKEWWGQPSDPNSAAGKYVQWITDENTAQQNYTAALAAAEYSKLEGDPQLNLTGIDQAKQQYAVNLADAAYSRDTDEADARYDEIADPTSGMLTPTKTYLDDMAQLAHDHAIKLADFAASHAENLADGMEEDVANDQYDLEVEQENEAYDEAVESEDEGWSNTDATAVSTWYTRLATDENRAADGDIDDDVQRLKANAAAESFFTHIADALLVTLADGRSSISNAFLEASASSWVTALTSFSTANPSAWATYDLSKETVSRDDMLAPDGTAKAAFDHEVAVAEATEGDNEADERQQSADDSADEMMTTEKAESDDTLVTDTTSAPSVGEQAATKLPERSPESAGTAYAGDMVWTLGGGLVAVAAAEQIAEAASAPPTSSSSNPALEIPPETAAPTPVRKSTGTTTKVEVNAADVPPANLMATAIASNSEENQRFPRGVERKSGFGGLKSQSQVRGKVSL